MAEDYFRNFYTLPDMKIAVIFSMLVLVSINLPGQEEQVKKQSISNTVYGSLSFGGLIGGLSVNYERKIADFTMGSINLRGGLGRVSGWDLRGNSVGVNWVYLFGRRKHHIELNMGVLGVQDRYNDPELNPTERFFAQWDFYPLLNAGYRLQKPEGGFMLRTGGGIELFYVGVGYSF